MHWRHVRSTSGHLEKDIWNICHIFAPLRLVIECVCGHVSHFLWAFLFSNFPLSLDDVDAGLFVLGTEMKAAERKPTDRPGFSRSAASGASPA